MKVIVIHRAGGYDRLHLEERPSPAPGPHEVLVRVGACGVNFADCAVRMGLYSSAKQYVGWPVTPGFEVAGEVAEVGEQVDDLALGTRVVAVTRFGGYAEEVVVPRHQAFPIPATLSLASAAGIPTVFLTAYYAVHELCRPRPDQHALVHSAAGGVGSALVQLLTRAGCEVVGVVGAAHKLETARDHGARVVIDTSSQQLWSVAERAAPEGFDMVFDANGVATLRQSYRHLKAPGRLVVYGFHTMLPRGRGRPSWLKLAWGLLRTPRFAPLDMTNRNRSVLAFNLSYLFDEAELLHSAMSRLLAWFADGSLRPLGVTPFAFAEVAKAHQALESGTTVGKLVLVHPEQEGSA